MIQLHQLQKGSSCYHLFLYSEQLVFWMHSCLRQLLFIRLAASAPSKETPSTNRTEASEICICVCICMCIKENKEEKEKIMDLGSLLYL